MKQSDILWIGSTSTDTAPKQNCLLTPVRAKRTIVRYMRTPQRQPIDWLFPRVRNRVLALLLMSPGQRWHLRDIARRTGFALGTVRRELEGLTGAGIAVRHQDGNRIYYQANQDSPIFPDLRGLMTKTAGLADVLREVLLPLNKGLKAAFVYGSQAAGTASAASDVDLMVVGDLDEMQLHRAVAKAEKRLSRTVNYSLLSREEYSRKAKGKSGFVERVLKGERILILGSLDEV